MINTIIPLGEGNMKVMAFTEDKLILSSKAHKDFPSLLGSVEKSGMLETVKTIALDAITAINYNEKANSFNVHHRSEGKDKKTGIVFGEIAFRSAVAQSLAEQLGFQQNQVAEDKTKPLLLNIAAMAGIAVATYIFRGMAIDAENGEHYVATGRRSGSKQLFANAVEALGPTWVTVIGAIGLLAMVYVGYRRFSNPALDTAYTK